MTKFNAKQLRQIQRLTGAMYRGIAKYEISLKWLRQHLARSNDSAAMFNMIMGLGLTHVYRDGKSEHDAQDPAVVAYVSGLITKRIAETRMNLAKARNEASDLAAAAELKGE